VSAASSGENRSQLILLYFIYYLCRPICQCLEWVKYRFVKLLARLLNKSELKRQTGIVDKSAKQTGRRGRDVLGGLRLTCDNGHRHYLAAENRAVRRRDLSFRARSVCFALLWTTSNCLSDAIKGFDFVRLRIFTARRIAHSSDAIPSHKRVDERQLCNCNRLRAMKAYTVCMYSSDGWWMNALFHAYVVSGVVNVSVKKKKSKSAVCGTTS